MKKIILGLVMVIMSVCTHAQNNGVLVTFDKVNKYSVIAGKTSLLSSFNMDKGFYLALPPKGVDGKAHYFTLVIDGERKDFPIKEAYMKNGNTIIISDQILIRVRGKYADIIFKEAQDIVYMCHIVSAKFL